MMGFIDTYFMKVKEILPYIDRESPVCVYMFHVKGEYPCDYKEQVFVGDRWMLFEEHKYDEYDLYKISYEEDTCIRIELDATLDNKDHEGL